MSSYIPQENAEVRLIGNPTRIGTVTGKQKPGRPGRGPRWQIRFQDTTQYLHADQIEAKPTEREGPVDLMEQGRLGLAIDLRRTLTHVRLTGRLADVIYSMETTNTEFYPYQFKPVLRFLNSHTNSLLIADEVGLGKTIEAGLIWTELWKRFDLRRLLVLCPAILCEKWKRELQHKIGVRADIVKPGELLRRLQEPESNTYGYAMICSLQGARPNKDWADPGRKKSGPSEQLAQFLRDNEHNDSLIDLLVIDEAHYLRNPESQTNKMGQLFRQVTENLLLLTATPIHNYNQDLFSLLQLLDEDTFERQEDLRAILEASRPLVHARDHLLGPDPSLDQLTKHLDHAATFPILNGNRQLQATREALATPAALGSRKTRAELARRLETVNPLAYVITRTRKRDVKEWRVVRDPFRESIEMTAPETSFYERVSEAIIDYAGKQESSQRFMAATAQRQMSSCMAGALRAWMKKRDNLSEDRDHAEDGKPPEIGPLTQALIDQIDDLGDLRHLILHDSKYDRLESRLRSYFADHPGEKVVLFASFRETLNYLGERLEAEGVKNLVMHGGIKRSKDDILDAFRTDPSVRVLLSSEMGSEGIDLQFCRLLVNYDLPWNPMRVEQRIGRLDRLGQEAKRIVIWNMLYADTIDDRIYTRLYEKLELAKNALGDFEEVLGDEVRALTIDLMSDHLSDEQQNRRIDQTAQAIENRRKDQEHLESEAAHLVAYGDYILNQIQAAKDLNRRIIGEDLRTYVIDYCHSHYPGCDFHQTEPGSIEYDITLSPAAKQDLEEYIRGQNLPTTTRLTQNTSRPVRCRFENRTTTDTSHTHELISQFHPLVRLVSASIAERGEQLTPAVSATLRREHVSDSGLAVGTYLLAASRWWVRGLQTVERLVFAACPLDRPDRALDPEDAERLANAAAAFGNDWFTCKHDIDLGRASRILLEHLFDQLEADYEAFVQDISRQNEDRADLQLTNLRRHVEHKGRQLRGMIAEQKALGKDRVVRMNEGRLQAMENRVERQELAIEKRRLITSDQQPVLAALLRVVDQEAS